MTNFIFFAGKSTITMGAAFSMDNWRHTQRCKEFHVKDGEFKINKENYLYSGLVYFADFYDKSLSLRILELIQENNIPCWPNPETLIKLHDRHDSLEILENNGMLNHTIWQGLEEEKPHQDKLPLSYFPYVLKTGNSHRGEGKTLIKNREEWSKASWEGRATLEPFFEGESVRILIIGDYHTSFKLINGTSWIKNSEGCDVEDWEPIPKMLEHAKCCNKILGLEVSGVDYIVTKDDFHLLEVNQFPGLTSIPSEDREKVKNFFKEKMRYVESSF